MDKKKKITYIISLSIVLFIVMLLVSGGTYAYWIWNSNTNVDVVFYTSKGIEDYIVYNAGNSHFIGDFKPTYTFCESANTTHSFYKTSTEIELRATINMDVNWIGTNTAASDSVYWVLTTGDNTISCTEGLTSPYVIASGKFNGVTSGQTIPLKENIIISTAEQQYTVWIWIDKNGSNLSSLSGETLDTNIWTQIDMLDSNEFGAPYQEDILNGAGPELSTGMIPVTISNTGTVTTVEPSSSTWYSYQNKQWANVVLVTDESRPSYYEEDGITIKPNQPIPEANILAYFVWIPSYSYKMNGTEQSISIAFNQTPSGYIKHPAFNFDGDKPGFWVGKFEPSHSSLDATTAMDCTNENCLDADGLTIKPNVLSKRSDNVSSQFFASRSIERAGNPFGLISSEIDTHMMKNSEWGAVAYLSHSQYGIDGEVRLNNNSAFKTGCGAASENGSSTSTCEIEYGKVSSGEYPQSTTGNITGVFDMAGGAHEYVMGVLADANGYPRSGNSGFNGTIYDGGNDSLWQEGFDFPLEKYYDLYTSTSQTTACNGGICYGHAISETSSWHGDSASFVLASHPWFLRGGYHSLDSIAGLFGRGYYYGNAIALSSFRLVAHIGA